MRKLACFLWHGSGLHECGSVVGKEREREGRKGGGTMKYVFSRIFVDGKEPLGLVKDVRFTANHKTDRPNMLSICSHPQLPSLPTF